jgi:TBCC domain-containing protein 1
MSISAHLNHVHNRSVSIEKCRNTTVLLGAVETSVQLNHCEGVTVIAACRTFVAR